MADITVLAQLRGELSNPAIGSKDHLRKLEVLGLQKEPRANWLQMAQKLWEDLDVAEKCNEELEVQNEYNRKRYQQLDLLIGGNILVMSAEIIKWQATGDA
ncbi:TPA: hypothetical protein R4304_002754 [Klebsiella variicola subsp. variicola]|nr:hypothetical protein [Klebsiella variicola subsp. variicola]